MQIITVPVPQLGNRTHLVHDGAVALVVDPPRDLGPVEDAAEAAGVRIVAVADTHVHNDYVSGAAALARRHGADYLLSADEGVDVSTVGVRGGDVVPVGRLRVTVLDTPGHTVHHQSFLARTDDPADPGVLFSGGSLLLGTVGRTDLVDRLLARHFARAQWESARRLGALDPQTRLQPTHGFGSFCATGPADPGSDPTVGGQRLVNPALRRERDPFVEALVTGFGPVPAYYRRMGPLNRRGAGAEPPVTPRALTSAETAAVQRQGGWVVDLRSAAEHAAGALPGSVSIPYSDQCATWTGWLVPWGAPLVLVTRIVADLAAPLRDLHRIGIEDVSTHVLGAATLPARPHFRRATWADHRAAGRTPVLLDVRQRDEVERAHLRGALHIPLQDLPSRLHSLPQGELWVHCASGYRAGIAASLIARTGRPVVAVDDAWEHAPTGPGIGTATGTATSAA
jgi:hydroxyacylglutathione hydrolase